MIERDLGQSQSQNQNSHTDGDIILANRIEFSWGLLHSNREKAEVFLALANPIQTPPLCVCVCVCKTEWVTSNACPEQSTDICNDFNHSTRARKNILGDVIRQRPQFIFLLGWWWGGVSRRSGADIFHHTLDTMMQNGRRSGRSSSNYLPHTRAFPAVPTSSGKRIMVTIQQFYSQQLETDMPSKWLQ